jgi:hypothetical protein
MPMFRKKALCIEAIRYYPSITCEEIYEWANIAYQVGEPTPPFRFADGAIYIKTLEGEMRVDAGDWIIRGIKGEFYPCKPDIFAATYEPV